MKMSSSSCLIGKAVAVLPSISLEHLRRVPQQERSRAKLRRVLEAADRLLADEGAGALTTTGVAAAAGISVGSLYAYLPDKEAIVEALALQYWAEFRERVEAVAEAHEREPPADPVKAVFDALAEGFRARPGFRALWFGGLRTERVRDVTRPGRADFGATVERILAVYRPDADPADRATVARMFVITGDGLLREAFRLDPDGDAALLDEGCRMLGAYLDARLGGSTA
jgi:AcrR family transcriptional regulator